MQSVKIKNKALLAIKDAYNEVLTITDDTISYKKTWAINKYLPKDEQKDNVSWKIKSLNNNDLLEKLKVFVIDNLNKKAPNTYECIFNMLFIDSNNKGYNILNYGISSEFKNELNKILSPYIDDKEISFLN
ncbi:MAG: hypothetical protein SOU19_09350 [Candidatus Caccosoma sp.]|nr:hypothetical protein [Candidatus Caccosoma sp.]